MKITLIILTLTLAASAWSNDLPLDQNKQSENELVKKLEERVRILEEKLALAGLDGHTKSGDNESREKMKIGKRIHGSILVVRNSGEALPIARTTVKLFDDKVGQEMLEKWKSLPQVELAASQFRALPQGLEKQQYFMQLSSIVGIRFAEIPISEIKTDIKGEFTVEDIQQDAVWVFAEFKTSNVYGFWLNRVSVSQEHETEVTLDHDNMLFLLQ
jgi:hypothetical protein